jgi:hypothetical protein
MISTSWSTLNTIMWVGHYVAFAAWTVLAVFIARHLITRDFQRLRVTLLYALNSLVFFLAWGMYLRLALIVLAPIGETREESIQILSSEASRYSSDHWQSAIITVLAFVALNVIYMKYVVRRSVIRHSLILLCADALVLFWGAYLSVALYYTGMLEEIDRHFLGA